MKITRIEIEDSNGRAAIERDGDSIRIDSIVKNPGEERVWVTKIIKISDPANVDENELWNVAHFVQRRCEGKSGTDSKIKEYLRVIKRLIPQH